MGGVGAACSAIGVPGFGSRACCNVERSCSVLGLLGVACRSRGGTVVAGGGAWLLVPEPLGSL